MFGRRPDGLRIRRLSTLRRFMPFLMPGRNEAAVYFEQTLDVSRTLPWLDEANRQRTGQQPLRFFHLVLYAVMRTLQERPQLHRFVVGRHLYQRERVELSFAVKKAMSDEAPMTTVKVRFEDSDRLSNVPSRIDAAIATGRGHRRTQSEKEVRLVNRLPRFLARFVLWAQRTLDYFGLLPGGMIHPDPLYASAFLANLGSVGLDAPFHHLYEYGTVPIFIAIGRIQAAPVVQEDGTVGAGRVVTIRYTFDERITDGYYAARSLERFQRYVEDPDLLEKSDQAE